MNKLIRKTFVGAMFALLTFGFMPASTAAATSEEESTCIVDEDGDGIVQTATVYGVGNRYKLSQVLGCEVDEYTQPEGSSGSRIFVLDNGVTKLEARGEGDVVIFDYRVGDVWTTAEVQLYSVLVEVKRKRHPKRLVITNLYEHPLWAKISNHGLPDIAAKAKIAPGDTKTLRVRYSQVFSYQYVKFWGKWRFVDVRNE